jgi:hypothetical protein
VPLLAALYTSKSTYARLKEETSAALQSLARVIDERDPRTAEHTNRVAAYVETFAHAIRLPHRERERLVEAAAYHDLGKIAVDVATLASAERLSDDELRTIKRHPRLSAHLLSPFGFAREIARYVELHHERYDGRGYYRVPAREIPMEAHVLIVADSFDAMTSQRPYRPALTIPEAAAELLDKAGSQFHPLVARAFAAIVREQPVESALSEQEIAALRAAFAPVRHLTPSSLRNIEAETVVLGLLCCALVVAGIEHVPKFVVVALGGIAAAVTLASVIGAMRRRGLLRSATAAIDDGRPFDALAAAGIDGWVAELEPAPGGGAYAPVRVWPPDVDALDLEEAANWALRREDHVDVDLPSGRRLFVTERRSDSQSRFALATRREPKGVAQRVVADLLAHLAHELDAAVVCSTHDPAVIEYADAELPLDSG